MEMGSKNMTSTRPRVTENAVCGRYLLYPDRTGQRKFEVGLRLKGLFRQSLPDKPLVTVVTVCRNAEKTVEQAMQSVLRQTYDNIEYIVIDGASSDQTGDILLQYEDQLDYCVSEPDESLYNAMNKGLSLASGEYVLLLNADDMYIDTAVETLLNMKTCSNRDIVSGLALYVHDDLTHDKIMRAMPYDAGMNIRMPLRHETMLVSSDIYNDVGNYDEQYAIIADLDLTLRIFNKGYTHYQVPFHLLIFRNTGVSNTNIALLQQERVRFVRQSFPFLKEDEVQVFGNLLGLNPSHVIVLANRYRDEVLFVQALKSYTEDRQSVCREWGGAKFVWPELEDSSNVEISVILPFFNASETIEKSIESVLAQTFEDFELICIDDQSPDNSREIVKEYAKGDPRISLFRNAMNIGHGASRNKGVQQARGRYVFHIDPDDTIPPNALEVLYTTIVVNGDDMVKGAFTSEQMVFGEPRGNRQRHSLCKGNKPIVNTSLRSTPSLLASTQGHWSFLYSRELARQIPYPSDLKMGQDSIFIVNALIQARSITIINDEVYQYKMNPHSAMNTFTLRKFIDGLEWRRRSWFLLKQANMDGLANHMLQSYWSDYFFKSMTGLLVENEIALFFERFRSVFKQTGIAYYNEKTTEFQKQLFLLIGANDDAQALKLLGN